MNLKLNIYQKNKDEILKKKILLFLLVSSGVMVAMTILFTMLYPEESEINLIITMVGVWAIFAILGFFLDRWGVVGNLIVYIICAGISLLCLVVLGYRNGIVSEEGKNAIQAAASYDALQNCETEEYRMVVLDRDEWEKDVRYYSKKHHHYLYYHVKPDLSVEEVPVNETVFFPDQYKGE